MICKVGLCIIAILLLIIYFKNYLLITKKNKNIEQLTILKKELIQKEKRYMLAIDGANDAIWEWDLRNTNVFISEKWTSITGYAINQNINFIDFVKNIIHEEDYNNVRSNLSDYMEGKVTCYQSEFRIKIKSGSYKWLFVRAKGLENEENKIIKLSGSITDITDRKVIEEEIKHRAYHDFLTKLPNKLLVTEIIEKTIQDFKHSGKKGAIIFIDLDDFKKVNDTLGHHYGDQLLKIIAEILKFSFDKKDTVARLG
ncbi:diguanylate cyclase [Clostridium sp. CF012]|nr:diguanylate cyclase [Clostridium sp. CF012]